MKVLLGIQARSNSTRLPGKIFEKIGEKPMLLHLTDRLKEVNVLSKANQYEVVVLCPLGDDPTTIFCAENGLQIFQGDPEDLIKRYLGAMESYKCDSALRITGDCPFLPKAIVEEALHILAETDYVTNCSIRSYPEGFDLQGATMKAWRWLDENQKNHREHPFYDLDHNEFIREKFVLDGLTFKHLVNANNMMFIKTSVDTKEDLELARKRYVETAGQQPTIKS